MTLAIGQGRQVTHYIVEKHSFRHKTDILALNLTKLHMLINIFISFFLVRRLVILLEGQGHSATCKRSK